MHVIVGGLFACAHPQLVFLSLHLPKTECHQNVVHDSPRARPEDLLMLYGFSGTLHYSSLGIIDLIIQNDLAPSARTVYGIYGDTHVC